MGAKHITIVAGFGRCGSSLVMQMLAAGGMKTPYSEFPSYEMNGSQKVSICDLLGGAIKILDPHIHQPPRGPEYRWIWLDRDPVQQAKSMAKFWKAAMPHMPEFSEGQITALAEAFKRDLPRANAVMLQYTQCTGILKLRFEAILADSAGAARKLNAFCDGRLNETVMAAAVVPRGPECPPYMLELEQLASLGQGEMILSRDDDIDFKGRVIRETDMAILFRANDWQPDGSADTWLPKSRISITHGAGDEVMISVPEWLSDDREML